MPIKRSDRVRILERSERHLFSPIIRRTGQAVAYIGVPGSLFFGGSQASSIGIITSVYAISVFGAAAIILGSQVPSHVRKIAYILTFWICVLFLIEVMNGDIYGSNVSGLVNFPKIYVIFLLYPFVFVGLREIDITFERLNIYIIITIIIGATWSIYSFVILGNVRPKGPDGMHSIPFAMVLLTWSVVLLSRALVERKPDRKLLLFSLMGLIPVVISESKLVLFCAIIGFSTLLLWWAWKGGTWIGCGVSFLSIAALVALTLRLGLLENRIVEFSEEVRVFWAIGDTEGATFGLRLSAAISAYLAFLDRPFFGYGLGEALPAAIAYRPDGLGDFSYFAHLHNDYLTHLVAFGVSGLLFLITLFCIFIFAGRRSQHPSDFRLSVVLVSMYAIYMMADPVIQFSPLRGLLVLLLALLCLDATSRLDTSSREDRSCTSC